MKYANYPNFNSIKVQLKQHSARLKEYAANYFNSIKVQLKLTEPRKQQRHQTISIP